MSAKKRVLLIGSPESYWVRVFLRDVLAELPEADVTVFPVKGERGPWEREYAEQGVRFVDMPDEIVEILKKPRPGPLDMVRYGLWLRRAARSWGRFDIVNCHYVSTGCLLTLLCLPDLRGNLLLSYWGSDLLRQSRVDIWLERLFLLLRRPVLATFVSIELKNDFLRKFRFDRKKTNVIYFGLPVFDAIQNTRLEDCWSISGQTINSEKIILAIGYNASEAQQHLAVIQELAKLPPAQKERLLILLQMTYAGSPDYIRQCVEACRESGFETVLFELYQSEQETAKVRTVTDIFIHAQTTDSFSASLCEYMYADTLVLNASWLHYKELDQHPYVYREFSAFSQLPGLVEEAMEELTDGGRHTNLGENRKHMWNLLSVPSCAEQWKGLYRQIWNQKADR